MAAMSGRRNHLPCLAALLLLLLLPHAQAEAQCPKVTIKVDNDIPGSGYSETSNNWTSYTHGACYKTFRYLSRTVGNGTRRGTATWKPKIGISGWYKVVVSYRATKNRTQDADYYVYDDNGGKKKLTISQNSNANCTYKDLGSYYCQKGGSCKVVLDGTDDSYSDGADMTTFTLVKCGAAPPGKTGPPPSGPCAAISNNGSYELCNSSSATCAGVYTNGDGCVKFCAAAGMICLKRFGGDSGCVKESNNPISCSQVNSHQSDWCECGFLNKPPDSGPPPGPDKSVPPPYNDIFLPGNKDRGVPSIKDSAALDTPGAGGRRDVGPGRYSGLVTNGCGVAGHGRPQVLLLILWLVVLLRRRRV